MNISQVTEYLDNLVTQNKLTDSQVYDYQLRLKRIAEYEEFEADIALTSLIHEIRQRISYEPTFGELLQPDRTRKTSRSKTRKVASRTCENTGVTPNHQRADQKNCKR